MSDVALELKRALDQLPPPSATLLEQLVRDVLALVRQTNPASTNDLVDAMGWPIGFFERYAGCLAGDDWQPPIDPAPASIQAWQ